ncbi:MAG: helix-turn-helix transcriptional regulator [Deltaproteobacteria bacterium]|nr:helix-turn-helix transcriptional regulator [Deltaproteobacteria bacterium]MBW2697197.1 helix-turn-helix transcriptional regulator [Deltaproteobacteria bacterium]
MSERDQDACYEVLVELVYKAALDPERWQSFVDCLSHELSGNVVTLWTQLPGLAGRPQRWSSFRGEIDPDIFARYWADPRSMPWKTQMLPGVTERFVDLEPLDPDAPLEKTEFFWDWMKPQGLAAMAPRTFVFGSQRGRPVASIAIYQIESNPPLTADELTFLDRLTPHLHRAYKIQDRLLGLARREGVLQEVIDRLPTAVVLVDDQGRVMATNESARASIESGLGLRIEDGRPVLDDPDNTEWLDERIQRAIDPKARQALREGTGVTQASRVAHRPVLVTPLLAPPRESERPEAAAVIFLGDPRLAEIATDNILRTLYGLTRAEADLTRLLADGRSLEEAAERRGVKPTTARSQLKRIFAKTGAKRQSDLVRIVLNGVAALRAE